MTTEGVINKPIGYARYTSLAAAKTLDDTPAVGSKISALVNGPVKAFIQCETQDVKWTDDGTTPTATTGMKLPKDTILQYEGDLDKLKFIEMAASASLNVSYYRY